MRMIPKLMSLILSVLLLAGTIFPVFAASATGNGELRDSGIDYSDTLNSLTNPERGFYVPALLALTKENSPVKNPTANLVHLRVGLSSVSPVNNDSLEPLLTENMLSALSQTLANVRANTGTVIIRFAYDNFNGFANREPSMETIGKHIEQLAPIFSEYEDIIASVEAGFIGPWGEMHTSTAATTDNFSLLINYLLDAVPESIGITVRQPRFYAKWRNVSVANLGNDIPEEGTDAYRIGIFNDGYLGSYNDLGTYANRAIETQWLSNQAKHTLFGGEAVLSGSVRDYNNIGFISQEMFKTHTSYLNSQWNNTLIGYWKNEEIYEGTDELYYGQTAYKYINDHLGYRLSLTGCKMSESVQLNAKLNIELNIKNSGCGNVVKEKKPEILLISGENIFPCAIALDARDWDSQTTTKENIALSLPEDIIPGEYTVFLRLSNSGSEKRAIMFANNGIWEAELGANRLGTVSIIPVSDPDPNPDPEPEPDPDPEPEPEPENPGNPDNGKSFFESLLDFFRRIIEFFKGLFR